MDLEHELSVSGLERNGISKEAFEFSSGKICEKNSWRGPGSWSCWSKLSAEGRTPLLAKLYD